MQKGPSSLSPFFSWLFLTTVMVLQYYLFFICLKLFNAAAQSLTDSSSLLVIALSAVVLVMGTYNFQLIGKVVG